MATVVYGNRGTGKSTFGRVVAEEVVSHGQRFCAIDVAGAFWGLKSTSSGDDIGLPIVIFGGEHADVPLEPGAGAQVADIVASISQSVILDFELMSKTKQVAFLGSFLERLYHANRDPLLLLMDEAQRYAPQRPMTVEANKTLGATEDITKLGRKHGLGPVVFTQRGSGLNKEVSELADVLVAFRSPGVLDQKRIREWLEANATAEQQKEVLAQISSLPTGVAIVASNHPELPLFGTFKIRRPRTFDSSATPKPGEHRAEPRVLSQVDIEALNVQMAEAIERAKAEDPKELRRRIAELEKQKLVLEGENDILLEAREPEKVIERVEVERIVEVPVVDDVTYQLISDLRARLGDATMIAAQAKDAIRDRPIQSARVAQRSERRTDNPKDAGSRPAPSTKPEPVFTGGDGPVDKDGFTLKLGMAERRILSVLQAHGPVTRQQLAIFTGYRAGVSTLSVALGKLRGAGLVTKGEPIEATEAGGLFDVGEVESVPPPGPERVAFWMGKLGRAEREVLRVMAEAHPTELARTEIAERAGYNPEVSTLSVALGKLRGMKLVDGFRVSSDLVGE